ncbi:MAG: cytochrome c-type biogenesis protein [Gammaproteobacteria bacterium]|nr:cytochrome c-type biogenesis protein [Gammaproteobacteria bacterium]
MIQRVWPGLLLALLLGLAVPGWAAIETFSFDSPEEEARFKELSGQLRCLVCQNQSIGDSNAELAQDLRREVYEMIKAGRTNEEIITFLVDRYGDFVLYKPPMTATTALLWAGPFLLIAVGLFFLIRFIRTRVAATGATEVELSAEERARADALLETSGKDEQR